MPEYRGVRAIAGILQKEWALREILHPHPVDVLATRLISDVAVPGVSASDLAIKMRTAPACELLLFSIQVSTLDLLEDARPKGQNFRLLVKPTPPRPARAHAVLPAPTGRSRSPPLRVISGRSDP